MGTSRSSKARAEWVGSARVFSGRPDPTWAVPAQVAKQLDRLWESLELWTEHVPAGPSLAAKQTTKGDLQ